ncbi:hypothetical protein BT96DRAFT_1023199 [Gymnopus androsaceus JB14]|uniref:P-loop containing nucleoside triphosphate hydrolase protein n=1 Tax=Gymnopus androsaceus JB14 TaxID=1447944 RepID=A0A6A4H4U7_9AGAR|nr:hypothetical protein BT96DRAFT_1023199 [Gymnopus androsaceus JB14]
MGWLVSLSQLEPVAVWEPRRKARLLLPQNDSAFFLIPSCAVAASAVIRLSQIGQISVLGGPVIFGYYLVRLMACFALSGITIVQLVDGEKERWTYIALLCIFLYSTILALVSVLANWRWSYNSVRHLNTVLCATLAVYAYRDIYPLGTFALTPQDKDEGSLLWAKISLLALAGVIIPLTVPRKYIPVDPKTSAFMLTGPISSSPYDDLPPLSDYDYADYLTKRSFHHFDPTVVVKRRNAFFSILRVFANEIAVLSVLVVLQASLEFTTPIGVKNLLEYLETKGVDAFFKPWVWIVGIFISRMLQTMASEIYLYISTRQVVQAKAILTETILEHALRIRVKAETSDEESFGPSPSVSGTAAPLSDETTTSESGTSSPADEGDEQTLHSATPSDARSGDATLQAGSSSASRRTSASNLQKDAGNANSTVPELNILGKVNNLITTDMQNIMDGRDVLRLVIQLPIQITLCVFFLYKVLGWRCAFVGLTINILFFPLPSLFTKMIRTRQKIRMMKTDAHIQMVTETMAVMRLIKVCGWETLMNSRIKEVREEELSYICKLRLLELATGITSYMYCQYERMACNNVSSKSRSHELIIIRVLLGVFYNLNRWIDVRLDLLGNIFSAGLAAYLVYFCGQTASNTGFSLDLAVLFTSSILHYIRIIMIFKSRLTGLERINAYIEIEQEPRPTRGVFLLHTGHRVEKLNARYSPGGPQVLQDINFHVKSGERIGVVWRTGSGKSTLMLSLLRCIYTGGEVYLDGIPISTLNLDNLRTKITIIPQIPELLSGTVRRNLDPFDQYDDAGLYDALRLAASNSRSRPSMVRESKLLILDEATSAIDYKTDAVIQSSLRHELKGDVTLITVAHRLQTIMDADKIMVLDAGRIVEYDSPKELLNNKAGHLIALVDESANKEHLHQMAEGIDPI